MTHGTVTFVTANTFEFDSRHRRAAEALAADGWRVVVVAMRAPHLPADEVPAVGITVRRPVLSRRILDGLPGPLRRPLGRLVGLEAHAVTLPRRVTGPLERLRAPLRRGLEILAYRRRVGPWASAVIAAAPEARVFVAKALVALPVAAEAARRTGGRYVYDIADLHVESGRLAALPGPLKAWLRARERRWMHGAAALLAVTPAMADEVARRYGVARPTVVMNAREPWQPDDAALAAAGEQLRAVAGVAPSCDVVLYQGAFRPDQGIDTLLAALDDPLLADRAPAAVFLGFGPLEDRLMALALSRPGRVAVLPPVPSGELLGWTAGADVAFVGTPPTTRNQTLTTPNKLFESVMAGVPVVVAAGTWTAALVAREDLGAVVEPWAPAVLAREIAALLAAGPADRVARRERIRGVALERLNWDVERERLVETFRRLGEAGS